MCAESEEKKEDTRPLSDRFDARLLSLYSKGIQDGMPKDVRDGQSYSFTYYDMIEVEKVALHKGPVLKDAYLQAQKEHRSNRPLGIGFGCSLIAVMDILDTQNSGSAQDYGYTQEEINDFWAPKREFPLFFVSMINLANTEDMHDTLVEIKKTFHDLPHLAYITFDHCDIILFGRGDRFDEYTRHIFQLYYAREKRLEDTITLYSFTGHGQLPEKEERFAVLVRIGVKDYPSREVFYQQLEKYEQENGFAPLHKYWLLERNDIGFYREDATISWLMQVRQAVCTVEEKLGRPWYTTYSLTVLISDGTNETPEIWKPYKPSSQTKNIKDLRSQMDRLYNNFKTTYQNAYTRLHMQVYEDPVLLRWLEDSYRLVVSLLSSRLSEDMGICLLPQFVDMFTYSIRFFSQADSISQKDLEDIQQSFGDFFSNVAVLVDSMNQTDRQFVHVPAFHLPSFEIPPQIMAYYTAIVHKMLAVLKDNGQDVFYGFTITPKLVNTLSVFSLSVQRILPGDEWISMNMDEMSYYTLQLTTETIAHEVSHFIGENLRERTVRKSCMIRCIFEILLGELAIYFADTVNSLAEQAYGTPQEAVKLGLDAAVLHQAADALWEQVQEMNPEMYSADTFHYSTEMDTIIQQIMQDIYNDLALGHCVITQFWDVLTTSSQNDSTGCAVLLERLRYYVQWKLGLQEDYLDDGAKETLNAVMKGDAEDILVTLIDRMMEELNPNYAQPLSEQAESIILQMRYQCYMFRETFADLQAILLLKMNWSNYCSLLLQGTDQPENDCTPRMFSVTKVLIACGIWEEKDIWNSTDGTTDHAQQKETSNPAFMNIRNALSLDLVENASTLASQHKISPTLCFYLIEYLTACAQAIQAAFQGERCAAVQELQKIHEDISDRTSFLERQKIISNLTKEMKDEIGKNLQLLLERYR
ncbi:MAG: hypothetical protein K2O18_04230 [Oscillospiraceae bacterium]|nr:hypothetical protein [Oscillospiraceae bacterium]